MGVQSLELRQRPRRESRLAAFPLQLSSLAPIAVGLAVAAAVFVRGRMAWAPEGDSALHLKLIEDIAMTGRLPDSLPYFPARVGFGGDIEAMFPYQYTPLFHVLGAMFYTMAGTAGVTMMNALAGGVIAAIIYSILVRRLPFYVATASSGLAFIPPTTFTIFTHVYMEPVMLALVFAAAWMLYVTLATRRSGSAACAGILMGLAFGVRQAALIYVASGTLVCLAYLLERRAWRWQRLRRELPWVVSGSIAFLFTAAPFALYLLHNTGSLGYADLSLPGFRPAMSIDPRANEYISGITKPHIGVAAWVNSYRVTLIYSERWLPRWYAIVPLFVFVPGIVHLERRGGSARMFARLAITQIVLELVLFATTHGNSRYVIASRMMFYAVIPAGMYALYRAISGTLHVEFHGHAVTGRMKVLVAAALVIVVGASMVGRGYVDFLTNSQELTAFRSRAYADAGAWINQNTSPDSLILAPRAYTAELSFQRNVTWITFYGNDWVLDAISSPDPRTAHDILERYGVDYVLIQDPPGTYVDRMPARGMRDFLRLDSPDTPYFSLVDVTNDDSGLAYGDDVTTNGIRIYRVNPDPVTVGG